MRNITGRAALPPELDPPASLRQRVLTGTADDRHVRVLPVAAAAATVVVLGAGAVVALQLQHDGSGGGGRIGTTAPLTGVDASPAATNTETPRDAMRCLAIKSLSQPGAMPRYLVLGSGASDRRVQLRELRRSCRTTTLPAPKCNGTLALLGLGSPQPAVPIDDLVRRLHFRCLQAK